MIQRIFSDRAFSLCQSRSFIAARLSCSFLPFASPISIFLHTSESKQNKLFSINRKYALLASTHENEELKIYNIWKDLKRKELLIIAPRHPERADNIIKNLQCQQLSSRSKNQAITNDTEVYLLDTVGELKSYFKNAELVIMGGSFVPVGGHNILEPASYNAAIITGPYMENFEQEKNLLLEKEAIIQASSINQLEKQIITLLEDNQLREKLKSNTELLTNNIEKVLQDYTDLILTD